jgi:hypothetical protein
MPPAARLLSTAVNRTRYISSPLSRASCQSHPTIFSTRLYSQQTSTSPNPPDHLNEAELHIFNKIKGELDPVKLEVNNTLFPQHRISLEDGSLRIAYTDP